MSARVPVWVNVMGRRMRTWATPEDAAKMRHGAAQKRARKAAGTRKANAALEAFMDGQGTAAAAIEAISRRVMYCDSHERLAVMLIRLDGAPQEIFWPVFCDSWSVCDATWWLQVPLLDILQLQAPAILPADEQKVFDALPERVQVFRGCSRERVAGLSWTTERHVAERFAHGHRGIRVPDPVVATGIVAKTNIIATNSNRNEHEVLLDPSRLRGLSVNPFVAVGAAA